MGAAAAVIMRKERDIVDTFRGAGATSASTARDPDELGVDQRVPFRLLVKHAVLREAGSGRYYLDDPTWHALRSMRRRLVGIIVILLVAVFLVSGAFVISRQ